MPLGIFQLVAALCMVCFLPGWFWDKALPKLRAALFSEQSGIARRLWHTARLAYDARWSPLRTRSYATQRVGRPPITLGIAAHADDNRLGGHTPQTSAPPTALESSRMGDEPTTMLRSSLATNLLAAFFLFYVFSYCLTTVTEFEMPGRVKSLGNLLDLNQSWGMFAPSPSDENYWYVVSGTLRDGQKVDLLKPTIHGDWRMVNEVSWENPDNLDENKYWRKYLLKLDNKNPPNGLRKQFARYVCRKWNEVHAGPLELTKFRFAEVEEETALPGDHQRATPQRIRHFTATCDKR